MPTPVLHIQSPTISTTFIQIPPVGFGKDLELTHPWLHLQVRDLGREFAFEIGVVDKLGRSGRIRFATFQVSHIVACIKPHDASLEIVSLSHPTFPDQPEIYRQERSSAHSTSFAIERSQGQLEV